MSNLLVVGNCSLSGPDYDYNVYKTLEDAGYVLGYNSMTKTSCVIMKEVPEEEESETE